MTDEVKDRVPYGRGPQFDREAFNADIASGFKTCTKCFERKTLDNFSKNSNLSSGMKSECRACAKERFAIYAAKNRNELRVKWRQSHYSRKYGVDKDLSLHLANPDNRIGECPICHKVERLVMDHDHKTGKIRSLICGACNSMLGYAAESIDTLYEAVAYIKKYRGY